MASVKGKKYRNLIIGLLIIPFLSFCSETEEEETYSRFREENRIVAVTDYNSVNYFVYRGAPMGYQYELLNIMADELGVEIDIKVSNDLDESFENLQKGEYDLLAMNLTVTGDRNRLFDFTEPHNHTRQVLVQRKPAGWKQMSNSDMEKEMIRNVLDLAGKTVHIQDNSAFSSRLRNLSEEIGDTIYVVEKSLPVEDLIAMVASGEIDYTVSDENLANVNATYYDVLDTETPVSLYQKQAWAVRKGDDSLRHEINRWMKEFRETNDYRFLYAKYFHNPYSARRVRSEYFTLSTGRISPYDEIIKEYSEEIGWDWRLLASMIYQESSFRVDVQSWAGAQGLMQLMPATASRFGVRQVNDPVDNIRAGVSYIKWLNGVLEDNMEDQDERLKFILASYNAGLGHVFDARALARKYGRDPDKWEGSVDYYLLNKSDPHYYLDSVVYHGFCRGEEPYRYVSEIIDRYGHYKNIIGD